MTPWHLLAAAAISGLLMGAGYLLAMRSLSSTIQATEAETLRWKLEAGRAHQQALTSERVTALEKVIESLDTNLGELMTRLANSSSAGVIRTTASPRGLGPRDVRGNPGGETAEPRASTHA